MSANRIWLELEIDPDTEVCNTRAALATNVLRRLGNTISDFWYNQTKSCYCFTYGGDGGFTELEDHGQWFNLDYLGRA